MWAKKYSVIYICIWATYKPLVPMSVQLFACRLFHALFSWLSSWVCVFVLISFRPLVSKPSLFLSFFSLSFSRFVNMQR